MLEAPTLEEALEKFRAYVIKQSRSNLSKMRKNSSKNLYNSLKGTVNIKQDEYQVNFEMNYYGAFQDEGVSGKKKKYNTPFSYKSKMPPASKLDKWIVRKGIAPRDKKGKFIDRKSLQFLIARGIYKNGIKPSLFFTKPYNDGLKRLPVEIQNAYGEDVEKYVVEMIMNYIQ
jgi:hypothetical protein